MKKFTTDDCIFFSVLLSKFILGGPLEEKFELFWILGSEGIQGGFGTETGGALGAPFEAPKILPPFGIIFLGGSVIGGLGKLGLFPI